jgi:hypothetical protein
MNKELSLHVENILHTKDELQLFRNILGTKEQQLFNIYIQEKADSYIDSFKEIFTSQENIDKDMQYFTDIRTLAKYNENIISGWLIEDFFIYLFKLPIFKEYGFKFKFDSHDSDRIIKKKRTFISSEPDFKVIHKNTAFRLEIQSLLINHDKFHIKQNKATHLLHVDSFLFCFLLKKGKILFFYPDDIQKYGTLTNIKSFGGKVGYEYIIDSLPKNRFITQENFIKKLVLVLYWFLYNKKSNEYFDIFSSRVVKKYKTIDEILKYLKNRA